MALGIRAICDFLNKNKDVNFIGSAITIQQANGVDACIEELRNRNIKPKGIVLIRKHDQTGRRLSASSFINVGPEVIAYEFDENIKSTNHNPLWEDLLHLYLSCRKKTTGRIIYYVANNVNVRLLSAIEQYVTDCSFIVITIDDGAGSYADAYGNRLIAETLNNPSQLQIISTIRAWVKMLYINQLFKELKRNNRIVDNRLFLVEKNHGKCLFKRNQNVVKYYEKVYSIIAKNIPQGVISLFENRVVINTQCLKENGITDGVVDYNTYEEFITEISNRGVSCVIKPHPRELNSKKYVNLNCDLYNDSTYSQESIIAGTRFKPICIVSIFSSTLLNLYGIFGVPAISLAKIIRNNSAIDSTFKKQLDEYIEQYNETIQFPETIIDAVQCVLNLLSK